MIYEIGWSTYDIRYILIMLCFIPLLIAFILFQKRYDTSADDIIPGILRGSKSHTKFMISLLLIFLMFVSLSPVVTLYAKNKNINLYKNGEYKTFTGIAQDVNKEYHPIRFENEDAWMSFSSNGAGAVKRILKEKIEEGKIYTVYYTYRLNAEDGKIYGPYTILRIDKVN